MSAIEIIAYGSPAPQGSKRHVGHGVMIESSAKVKPWRQDVLAAAIEAKRAIEGFESIDAPIVVRMVFTMKRPRGHYRTGKNAHLIRASAPSRPSGTPDLSKLARSTEDALTNACIWRDDARVVEYERLAKVFIGEDHESLDAPGVRIVIRVESAAVNESELPE